MPQTVLDVGETKQSPSVLMVHAIEGYLDGLEEDEPPLNDDELEGLRVAERELNEGKGIPFSDVMRDLW